MKRVVRAGAGSINEEAAPARGRGSVQIGTGSRSIEWLLEVNPVLEFERVDKPLEQGGQGGRSDCMVKGSWVSRQVGEFARGGSNIKSEKQGIRSKRGIVIAHGACKF